MTTAMGYGYNTPYGVCCPCVCVCSVAEEGVVGGVKQAANHTE